jgi:cystathionine beta-lyase family protein involved in aluminum resistance
MGREKLDAIVAKVLGAEAALVRLQLFSGTHAISTALFGALRPGDNMLCVSGHPYDTLEEVIGQRAGSQTGDLTGSLLDWNIGYSELGLLYGSEAEAASPGAGVAFNLKAIDAALEADSTIKLVHIQRYGTSASQQ